MSIVKLLLDGRVIDWNSPLIRKENEVRVFTSPGLRSDQVKKYYWTVRRMFPGISEEALDAAFETYILGWIIAPEVLSFARHYDAVLSGSNVFSVPNRFFSECTGDLFSKEER